MNVLRLRVTDDMPTAARVLVWPRDQGGYFIYVRPGTPRGSVRCALRELKDTSAAHRELTVMAFAAKNAWRSPRERVMSFGAGLATTVITSGLATSVTVTGMAVSPAIHHHARSFLPPWAELYPGADRAGKPAHSASRHPSGSPSATPSHLPHSHPGSAGVSSRSAGRGHLEPGAQKPAAARSAAQKSAAARSAAQKSAAARSAAVTSAAAWPGAARPGAQKSNAARSGVAKHAAAMKAAKEAAKAARKAAKPSRPVTARLARHAKASAAKPVKPA